MLKLCYWQFDANVVYRYYCTVMLDRLPELIDPLSFADKRSELIGQIDLSSLDRLAEMLADNSGTVAVKLVFGREGRLATIEGRITASLAVQCQNCLEVMYWPVDCKIKLAIVSSLDEADKLPEDYEPLLVRDKKIPLPGQTAGWAQLLIICAAAVSVNHQRLGDMK